MSQDVSFRRKIIYIGVIALLLYPLFRLGQPATPDNPGGVLAQLRSEYRLAEAELGEIDPAGEAMKLATLGLQPVATAMLWHQSQECHKKEDWDGVSAAVNQIKRLQPNFISIWEFQAHNLSYNISVEFDDYRYRYHWVKKGISFLIDGIHRNRENPRLLHQTGWITGQKIGRADEHVQFRQMFRVDDEFHTEINNELSTVGFSLDAANGYDARPDNWLVGRLWYERAESAVDNKGIPLRGKSPLIFYNDSPMSYINYASTIEEEGVLGDTAKRAWRTAGEGWAEFGRRQILTSWGHNIRLGDAQRVSDELETMRTGFHELLPGLFDRVKQEKIDALKPDQKPLVDLSMDQLTDQNFQAWSDVQSAIGVSWREVAERAEPAVRDKAVRLAIRIQDHETLSNRIAQYRNIVNFEYWEIRCRAEQTDAAVQARENLFQAKKLYAEADLEKAKTQYEAAWHLWRKIYDDFPRLMDDVEADQLVESVKRYGRLLQQLDEQLPADFPLFDFLKRHDDKLDDFWKEAVAKAASSETPQAPRPETSPPGTPPTTPSEPDQPAPPTEPASEKPASEKPPPDKPASEKPAPTEAEPGQPAPEQPSSAKPAPEQPEPKEPASPAKS